MSAKISPLGRVNEKFGSKEKLVDVLVGMPAKVLERGEEDKDAFKQRLLTSANTKLLRLHQLGEAIQQRFGSKEQMVDALLTLQNRGKDQDYRTKLSTLSIGKLYDQFVVQERAQKRAAKAPEKAAPKKPAKKTQAQQA